MAISWSRIVDRRAGDSHVMSPPCPPAKCRGHQSNRNCNSTCVSVIVSVTVCFCICVSPFWILGTAGKSENRIWKLHKTNVTWARSEPLAQSKGMLSVAASLSLSRALCLSLSSWGDWSSFCSATAGFLLILCALSVASEWISPFIIRIGTFCRLVGFSLIVNDIQNSCSLRLPLLGVAFDVRRQIDVNYSSQVKVLYRPQNTLGSSNLNS